MVDAVTDFTFGERLVAIKNVTVNEDFFPGHFPGAPLMPGVLMIESMAQAASVLLLQAADGTILPHRASLRGADGVKFRRPLGPGDRRICPTRRLIATKSMRSVTRRNAAGRRAP